MRAWPRSISRPSARQQGGEAVVECRQTEQQNDGAVDDVGDGFEVGVAVLKAGVGGAGNQVGGDEPKSRHAHAEQGEDAVQHDGVGTDEQAIADPENGKGDATKQRQGQRLFFGANKRTDNMAVMSHKSPPFKW